MWNHSELWPGGNVQEWDMIAMAEVLELCLWPLEAASESKVKFGSYSFYSYFYLKFLIIMCVTVLSERGKPAQLHSCLISACKWRWSGMTCCQRSDSQTLLHSKGLCHISFCNATIRTLNNHGVHGRAAQRKSLLFLKEHCCLSGSQTFEHQCILHCKCITWGRH